MAGTKAGSQKALITVRRIHGQDFFKRVGAKGGAASRTGGFAAGEAGRRRARIYGAIGGSISTRRKVKPSPEQRAKIRKQVEKQKAYQHLLAIHEKEKGRVV